MKQKADFIIDSEITSIARGNITPELNGSCSGTMRFATEEETKEFKKTFRKWVSDAEEQDSDK